jgi:hypothetical protein
MLALIASGALLIRLQFVAGRSELSDDVHRNVWEGALVGAGVDPYTRPPASPELSDYQERWRSTFERVNHPEVPAAYPPLALAVHAGVVAAAGGADRPGRARAFLRGFYGACDLLVCLPLAWLLRQHRRPLALLSAWAWNPWIALEFAGSAHLDALAILCTLSGLACFPRRERPPFPRAALGLALLSAGAAVKLLPAALVPFALRRTPRPLLGVLTVVACAGLSLVPFLLATGSGPRLHGLSEYAFRWESFSLLYRGLEPLFSRAFAYDESWSDPRRLARGLVIAAWLALALHAWRRGLGPARASALLFGGFLVLTPTLHPWYLAWIVPFLALRPALPFGVLVAAAPLLYWPVARWRLERVWEEPDWLFPLLGGSFWVLLVLELASARRGADGGARP